MKKITLIITIAILFTNILNSQIIDQLTEIEEELDKGWNVEGLFSLGFSQISLTNWAAGGESSVAGNTLANIFAGYVRDKLIWTNTLDIGYGLQRREDAIVRKTDDKIDLLSKIGLEAAENLFYTGMMNLRTQMTRGYDSPGDDMYISTFLSPGYLIGGLGIDYRPVDNLSLFLAPSTVKMTIVMDKFLADRGSYGVEPGENLRYEFGSYFRADLRTTIHDNVRIQSKLDIFSNYLYKPQNMDINWETLLIMQLTEFIAVSFSTHLIYDEDMVFDFDPGNNNDHQTGPRVQFKQLFIIGLSYNL